MLFFFSLLALSFDQDRQLTGGNGFDDWSQLVHRAASTALAAAACRNTRRRRKKPPSARPQIDKARSQIKSKLDCGLLLDEPIH